MGDLAVSELAVMAEAGKVTALRDLLEIGTPGAALALAEFLWQSNHLLAEQSAWYLAALLPQAGVEEALKNYSLKEEQRRTDYLDWVWQPFADLPNSALPIITGRLAYLLAHASVEKASILPLALDARLIIPLCTVQLIEQLKFPGQYSVKKAEALLAQEAAPELDQQIIEYINESWEGEKTNSQWWLLFSRLTPRLQLELLNRMIQSFRSPTRNDWRNIFRPVTYDFRAGWQYRIVLGVAALASAIALVQSAYLPLHQPESWINWLGVLASVVIIDFWLFLWSGTQHPLEPDLFVSFGLMGTKTFFVELRRLFIDRLIWAEAKAFLEVLNSQAVAGTVGGTVAVAVAGVVFVFVFGADAVAGNFAVAGVVFGAVLVAGASTLAVFIAGASTVADTGNGIVFGTLAGTLAVAGASTVFGTVAVAGTVAGAVAGAGIGFWVRAARVQDAGRFLAVFAFPFFCWLPIVGWFATVALLNVVSWQGVVLAWSGLLSVCTGLWQWGQWCDRQAGNPLKGIFDVKPPVETFARGMVSK